MAVAAVRAHVKVVDPTIGGVATVESRRKLTESLWFVSSIIM